MPHACQAPVRTHRNIVDSCRLHASAHAEKAAFVFIARNTEEVLTFGELDTSSRSLAAHLLTRNLQGRNVLLIYPSGVEFIKAFVACLYAGAVPVPVNTPTQPHALERFQKIIADAHIEYVLSTGGLMQRFDFGAFGEIGKLATDEFVSEPTAWAPASPDSQATAFIQYTSGSTGDPKGAVISHANLVSNLEMIQSGFANDEHIVGVNWLPLFHDMGLVGNVLQPLYLGITCIHMSPLEFVQKPVRWLRAISDYRGTTSGGPTFGYAHCLARVKDEECVGLDLSHWRIAYCGAEPVRHDVLEAFARRFSQYGFDPSSFYPCYGMAETTLIVTGPLAGTGVKVLDLDRESLQLGLAVAATPDVPCDVFVSNGRPINGTQVAIVDPETGVRKQDMQIGEVWVSGSAVAKGYFGNPCATRERFGARIEAEEQVAFYRTGDLGFIKDEELYITGRLKDLIVIRGRNYYPQDIEQTAFRATAGLREQGGVAFSQRVNGQEGLVLVHEVEKGELDSHTREQMVCAIRQLITEHHGIAPDVVMLIKSKGVAKTSSGKLRRAETAARYQRGELLPA